MTVPDGPILRVPPDSHARTKSWKAYEPALPVQFAPTSSRPTCPRAAAVAVPVGAASAGTSAHHSLAPGTSADTAPNGDYCELRPGPDPAEDQLRHLQGVLADGASPVIPTQMRTGQKHIPHRFGGPAKDLDVEVTTLNIRVKVPSVLIRRRRTHQHPVAGAAAACLVQVALSQPAQAATAISLARPDRRVDPSDANIAVGPNDIVEVVNALCA